MGKAHAALAGGVARRHHRWTQAVSAGASRLAPFGLRLIDGNGCTEG
jgi:hypothetical protein